MAVFRGFSALFGFNSGYRNLCTKVNKMPKEPKDQTRLQAKREARKLQVANFQPGRINLQTIGNGSDGSTKSLYLYTDHNKYMFNCGEGTQRLAQEHKIKLAKLENVFLTHMHWDCIGGVPGICLTVQEMASLGVTIHGPAGSEDLFQASRNFLLLGKLRVSHIDCSEVVAKSKDEWHFQDNILRIRYIPIKSNNFKSYEHREPPVAVNYRGLVQKSVYGNKHESSPPSPKRLRPAEKRYEQHLHTAVSYLCSLHPKPGMLRADLCVEKGVPPGPLLGQLKAGQDVTLEDGSVIKSVDVCSPEEPGALFLVVDCPSEDFLDNFTTSAEFQKYQISNISPEVAPLELMVHFTPKDVLNSERYKEWMASFPVNLNHLVLSGSNHSTGYMGAHIAQHQVNMVDSDIFPLLKDGGFRSVSSDSSALYSDFDCRLEKVVLGEMNLRYHLRPKSGLDGSLIPAINSEEKRKEISQLPGFEEAIEELKRKVGALESKGSNLPAVLFLGTGSCIPNKTRNVSCILLETRPDAFFMLDCGEGSYGQLHRFHGPESDNVLCNLKAIFISHFHADHHLGLLSILIRRREAFARLGKEFTPLVLIAPVTIEMWLLVCSEKFHRIDQDIRIIWNNQLQILTQENARKNLASNTIYQEFKEQMGLEVVTSYAKHCFQAYGITIRHKDGWSIVYSGDTMPAPELIEAGKGCDLLIHEATMEDDLEEEAKIKCHSTTSQAIDVGRQMKAKFTLLTHFSQRYAKLPIIPNGMGDNVGFAFDNMRVSLADLKKLPLFTPCMKLIYHEYYQDMEEKTAKKLQQREVHTDHLEKLRARIITR